MQYPSASTLLRRSAKKSAMSSPSSFPPHSLLIAAFPATEISVSTLTPKEERHRRRISVELQVAKLEGLTWVDVSAQQARGTWDVLELLAPSSLPIIFPGYLKWLWQAEEADVMVMGLQNFLIQAIDTKPDVFTREQLKSLAGFMAAALRHTRHQLALAEVRLYKRALRRLEDLALKEVI